MDVHHVRLGDFKLPAESSPGRRVPKRKSQPHSRFNAPDWVWYYVLRHSVTRGAEETGIYGHNRVFATSLAVGVVNLKDVHGRLPRLVWVQKDCAHERRAGHRDTVRGGC